MIYIFCFFISYLLGSIPVALIIGKFIKNIDIRNFGSGNSGGTNIGRIIGFKWGLIVILLDILKGFIVAYIGFFLGGIILSCLSGITAIIGHTFPILAKFKGGKGVATGTGVFLFLIPIPVIFSLIFFVIIAYIFKHVFIASLTAAIFCMIIIMLPFIKIHYFVRIIMFFSVFFIFYTHRNNIKNFIIKKNN